MSDKEVKNVVASVLGRLRNTAKESGATFQQILQQYAIERFLYRISKSRHAQGVILKGGCWRRSRPNIGVQVERGANWLQGVQHRRATPRASFLPEYPIGVAKITLSSDGAH
jgi:hypothetical protein